MTNDKFLKLTNTVYKLLEFFPESDPLKNRAKDKALEIMENLVFISGANGWVSFQQEKIKTKLLEEIDTLLGYLWIGKSQGWLNSVNCLIISNEYEKIKKEIEPTIELTQKLPGLFSTNFGPKNDVVPEEKNNPRLVTDKQEGHFSPNVSKASEDKTEWQNTQISATPALDNTETENERALDSLSPRILSTVHENKEVGISDSQNQFSSEFPVRQKKILEFLEKNGKAQVMELQTILPDITKRTIRRDLDELLEAGKINRLGEFNQVFYTIKE